MGTVLSLFASGHSLATSIRHKSLTTMSQERVKSKNLFNFRPQGFIDPDVVFYDEKMKKEMGMDPVAMEEQMLSQTETEFAGGMRAMMDGMLGQTPFATDPAYIEAYASCDNTVLKIPTKHDGEYNVKVLVHAPKSLSGENNRPAIVYAHGGGCIGGSALMMQKIWQAIAGPDFESKRKDPLLFPGKASPELFSKMPPTIVWEDEFDMYITPATRFAHKLRTAGRLLEFVCIPGAKHGSGMMPSFRALWKLAREAWRVAIQEYLVKN